MPQSAYLRGLGGSDVLAVPPMVLRDAQEDVRIAWGRSAARAIDAMHNNGWIAGLVDVFVGHVIGEGLRADFKPDFSWAGWNDEQTGRWTKKAQRLFEADARQARVVDAGGRHNFAQLQASALRQWLATGNIVGQILTIRRPGSPTRTKLRLLQSHWLSSRTRPHEGLDQGVYRDRHGASVGYLFEFRDCTGHRREVKLPAFDGLGRTVAFQIFDGQPGQLRGISVFAPCLRVLRDYDQLSNATMKAAMLHAIFAATIESDYPTIDVMDGLRGTSDHTGAGFRSFLEMQSEWASRGDIDLSDHGRIAHMFTGEKFTLHSSKYPNANYEPFANMLLRETARCVGALYEDVSGDYSNMTQASMKAAISKQWPIILYRRRNIMAPFCDAYADAWLEEKVLDASLDIPGGFEAFLANRAAVCRRDWSGPGKPVPDELKQAKTHELYRNMGVISDREIAADRGVDIDDVYEERAREQSARQAHNVHGGITNGGSDIDDFPDEGNREQEAG